MSKFTANITEAINKRSKRITGSTTKGGHPSVIIIRELCFILPFDAGYSLHFSPSCDELLCDNSTYHGLIPLALLIFGDYFVGKKYMTIELLSPENKTANDVLYMDGSSDSSRNNINLVIYNEQSTFQRASWLYQFSSATFSSYIMELMMPSFAHFIAVADVSSIVDGRRLDDVAKYMRERKGTDDAMKGGVTTMCVYWTRRDNPE